MHVNLEERTTNQLSIKLTDNILIGVRIRTNINIEIL